jgi:hypothetical protein
MDMNALQQWMNFADKNGLFNQYKQIGTGSGFQPTQFNVPMMEANWARGMGGPSTGMPSGMPNYFAGLQGPQPGVQIGENPYSARASQLMNAQAQVPQPSQMGNNYLAKMLR